MPCSPAPTGQTANTLNPPIQSIHPSSIHTYSVHAIPHYTNTQLTDKLFSSRLASDRTSVTTTAWLSGSERCPPPFHALSMQPQTPPIHGQCRLSTALRTRLANCVVLRALLRWPRSSSFHLSRARSLLASHRLRGMPMPMPMPMP